MDDQIHELIYSVDIEKTNLNQNQILASIDDIAKQAFFEKNEASLLIAHRILYELNMAHLACSWESSPKNISHPLITATKYKLEQHWETAERKKYNTVLQSLPDVSNFPQWVKQSVRDHHSNELHPIFIFLRDNATFEQMREFLFQETPLEMLFGDILAFMLPGTYGSIKIEYLKNYWDEVGHGEDKNVHRNLRGNLMKEVKIPTDCYIKNYNLLIREELELINMYLSFATNRAKHSQLIGVMLATELMIPGRFVYQIEGWKRHGLGKNALTYLIEHTSVDEAHAEDWLYHVVMPILGNNAASILDIILGVNRRLDVAAAVLDKLYLRIQAIDVACIDAASKSNESQISENSYAEIY